MQSEDIPFNPGGDGGAADWNRVAPPPQRLGSIYIYQRGGIIQHIYQMFPRVAALDTGIEKISSLMEPNPIHPGHKQALPGGGQPLPLS